MRLHTKNSSLKAGSKGSSTTFQPIRRRLTSACSGTSPPNGGFREMFNRSNATEHPDFWSFTCSAATNLRRHLTPSRGDLLHNHVGSAAEKHNSKLGRFCRPVWVLSRNLQASLSALIVGVVSSISLRSLSAFIQWSVIWWLSRRCLMKKSR